MGLFQKLGLVEEVDRPSREDYMVDLPDEQVEDVNLEAVNTNTLIADVYDQNDLNDQSKSIFKVEELMNSLPKDMVTETKKNSVLSALGVFGLNAEIVTEDGEKRVEILKAALAKISSEKNELVADYQERIESCKETIAELEKNIAEEQAVLKASTETINAESDRISKLISFVGGEA